MDCPEIPKHLTYKRRVSRITNEILDYVERKFVPGLRRHIDYQEVWSPIDLCEKVGVPQGNIYGEELSPRNLVFHKVPQTTPLTKLFLVGATTGYPGLLGVITGSLELYDRLRRQSSASTHGLD